MFSRCQRIHQYIIVTVRRAVGCVIAFATSCLPSQGLQADFNVQPVLVDWVASEIGVPAGVWAELSMANVMKPVVSTWPNCKRSWVYGPMQLSTRKQLSR